MKKPAPLDFSAITTYPLTSRRNKVNVTEHFCGKLQAGMSAAALLDALPAQLGSETLRRIAAAVVAARRHDKPVIVALGGHVIKCGLQPALNALIEAGMITAVVMNGSAAIHDYEIALSGATSEDVGAVLHSGEFGFAEETGGGMNRILRAAVASDVGFGEALARAVSGDGFLWRDQSLLAACQRSDIPVTVHVAIGTDIIHQHPSADGAVLGEMTMRDFRLLTALVAELGDGGVWLNIGSAVLLPEVFLKAISVARNLGHAVHNFTTANLDMIQHYRPLLNVVGRPTTDGGHGYTLTGHHEINLPLLALAILEYARQPIPR